jgi:NADPH:quinone reductase-like Zn-dependent oxidoreductase
MAGLTSYQAIRSLGKITGGMRVLVNGCTGGVGHLGVQLAMAFNTECVGICSSKNVQVARQMGIDHIFAYDDLDLGDIGKFDLVFDAAAKLPASRMKKLLNRGGRWVSTLPSAATVTAPVLNPFRSRKHFTVMVKPNGEQLSLIADLMKERRIQPRIEHSFMLDEIRKAHERMAEGSVVGKLVIQVAG